MREGNLIYAMQLTAAAAALICFGLVVYMGRAQPARQLLGAYREFRGFLALRRDKSSWYRTTDAWLLKKGARVHFGAWMQPGVWLGMRLVLACVGFLAGLKFSPGIAAAAAAGLFFGAKLLVIYLNRRDNERMLPEIRLIYHALEIQIRAGVYAADALTECYAGVRELRLRQALLDLAGAITMKADIYEALEQMQAKFDNQYIDALCITILQALESGQAVELLGDIAEQVKDMEVTLMAQEKSALDRSVTFYQLGILAAMLGVVLYACVTQMFAAALTF